MKQISVIGFLESISIITFFQVSNLSHTQKRKFKATNKDEGFWKAFTIKNLTRALN